MKVNVRQTGDVTILDLNGKITIGSGKRPCATRCRRS